MKGQPRVINKYTRSESGIQIVNLALALRPDTIIFVLNDTMTHASIGSNQHTYIQLYGIFSQKLYFPVVSSHNIEIK